MGVFDVALSLVYLTVSVKRRLQTEGNMQTEGKIRTRFFS